MSVYLHGLETWTPPTCYPQDVASEQIQRQFQDRKTQRILRHMYKQSEIDWRYTAVEEFGRKDNSSLFRDEGNGQWRVPPTGERNRTYMEVSKEASVELARKTLAASPGVQAGDITHVITASCTGFYNPGPDYHIIRGLGLSHHVQRYHLGFMGCYAAFPALRLARTLCLENPEAVVLIQCMELCSLHLQLDADNPESLVAGSLFADGAGCALVTGKPPAAGQPGYRIEHMASALTPTGEEAMAWEIGNHGFDIVLSGYVPRILGENIRKTVLPQAAEAGWSREDVEFWCVHPGGKAILDRVSEALDLEDDALDIARHILRNYGNMSSATILFLLKQGLADHAPGTRTAAMAFGPGLTVEMGFMERFDA
jgi:predicted naringenin-chalcone synthase